MDKDDLHFNKNIDSSIEYLQKSSSQLSNSYLIIKEFKDFPENLKQNHIRINPKSICDKIRNYSFIFINETADFDKYNICQNVKSSKIISVNEYIDKESQCYFFVACFQNTVIMINQASISILQDLFTTNSHLKICLLSNTRNILKQNNIIIQNEECDNQHVSSEISNFHKIFLITNEKCISSTLINIIRESISAYLIQQAYEKANEMQNLCISTLLADIINLEDINETNFIKIRDLGIGTSFYVGLFYHIIKDELFAIKNPIKKPNFERLINRYIDNYTIFNHPLLPKLYGKVKDKNDLIVQFINGQSLESFITKNKNQLNDEEKYYIISQIIIIIEYLHNNEFIFRDLKPDNIIIDKNKTIFVIDFDRNVKINDIKYDEDRTQYFSSVYHAPEIITSEISYKSDIYSIGQIIYYIMNGKNPESDQSLYTSNNIFNNNQIQAIYINCINNDIKCRPYISELKEEFINIYPNFSKIDNFIRHNLVGSKQNNSNRQNINKIFLSPLANQYYTKTKYELGCFYYLGDYNEQNISISIHYFTLAANQNNPDAQYKLGCIYYEGQYIEQDINKSIHYFTLAANQNHPDAQYKLGCIYYEGQCIDQNINKSIHYFTLASNQNHLEAQFSLGCIYYEGKYIERNINKSIYYFTLASNQNHPCAQSLLGCFYYLGNYIEQDFNKSIHYLTLAANQNYSKAQYQLGLIYYSGNFIEQDINKSIHYLTLAANQNDPDAQYKLGCIYYEGKYIERNINKSIYYFTLASNQNDPDAQCKLGCIYYLGNFIEQDINKSIHYLTLASNQNHQYAQLILGVIYYSGKYITRDINKSIHYFTLAANRNHSNAQCILGVIYHSGKYITRDIYKSIYYLKLASNQNNPKALYMLGYIYYEGKYIKRDINKSIHYLVLAANQNYSEAQFILGYIYYEGKYIKQDINKSIYYFTIASNQNLSKAQYILGLIYYDGKYITQDINKSVHYLILASNNDSPYAQLFLGFFYLTNKCEKNIKDIVYLIYRSSLSGYYKSYFFMGYFYHKGIYVERDIKKSIYYYKEGSSFNCKYSKNNLGIIYKHGFGTEIKQNIGLSIAYFDELVRRFDDAIFMYNLIHIYIFEDKSKERIEESIDLLIKSKQKLKESYLLLCIALIKKHGHNIEKIKQDLIQKDCPSKLISEVSSLIEHIIYESVFQEICDIIKNTDYLYDEQLNMISSQELIRKKIIEPKYKMAKKISTQFYEGFDLM